MYGKAANETSGKEHQWSDVGEVMPGLEAQQEGSLLESELHEQSPWCYRESLRSPPLV